VIVVDTNVLAYLLIAGDRTRDVQALLAHDAEWKSESFILVEFGNILVTYERVGGPDATARARTARGSRAAHA